MSYSSKKLESIKDTKYQEFQSKLVPNIPKESILGIKSPELKKIAKEIFLSKDREDFLASLPHHYYEENLIHFFIIALIKDFDECIKEVDKFLPYVDCWPVSDQGSPKVFKKHHKELLEHVKRWITSSHIYTARFGLRILMNEYLDDDFKEEYLSLAASKKGEDYYLKMMVAWYFATALAKQYDATVIYFENHKLDDCVHKKAIQKALESYRVSEEHKKYLKSLR